MLRRSWPVLLGLLACGAALLLFDWPMVARAWRSFDLLGFLLVGVPAVLGMFAARSLRWIALARLPLAPASLWRSHAQSAVAIALATVTPAQAGEALKLKFARDEGGEAWSRLGVAFLLERLADLAALGVLAAFGLGIAQGGGAPLLALAGLAVLGLLATPWLLRRLARWPLPARAARLVAPFAELRIPAARMALVALCTALSWGCVLLQWQALLRAAGLEMGLAQTALAITAVTLAVLASMVPGGFGVAEWSARAVLVWQGVPPGEADAAAILLRLLTPLILALGLLHALALLAAPPARGGG